VILRDPNGLYVNERSDTILKVKIFQDSEAKIIRYKRNKSVMVVKDCTSKKEFQIKEGITDKLKDDPPEIGTIITYKYDYLNNSGFPECPEFDRVRWDSGM